MAIRANSRAALDESELVLAGLVGQLKRLLAHGLTRNQQKAEHAVDPGMAQLWSAVDDLCDLVRGAQRRARTAIRERDALERTLTELEERLGGEILAHEKTARELSRQSTTLHKVVEGLPYCVFWRDRNGVYLGANRNKLRALGLTSLDQLVGKTAYETGVSREEADFYYQVDRQVMESGQPIFNLEEIQQRPDGPRVLLISKVPLRDYGGDVVGIMGMYVDITERRRLEPNPAARLAAI